jgi:menaquinone-specific isochorismate synthase
VPADPSAALIPLPSRVNGGGAPLRIVSAAVGVEGARWDAFLRLFPGEPRGFWGRGDRWVAHAGALATLEAPSDRRPSERFRRVTDEAARVVAVREDAVVAGGDARADGRLIGRLRFYGGFAFRSDHQPSGFWEAFPSALFILPAVELVGDSGKVARLRARARLAPGEDAAEATRALELKLARLVDRIRVSPGEPAEEARTARTATVAAHRSEMGRVTWEDAVGQALSAIEAGRFSKVVLARTLDVTTAAGIDPVDIVRNLRRDNPETHVFLFEPKPGRPLLGAAPETVATLRKGVFHATAVAGSIARGATEEERRWLAAQLLGSRKDREEHRIVREDIVARLSAFAEQVRAEDEPHVLSLARIQHLETEIRARVQGRSVLELLEALHPTPAVCGYPRDSALDFLRAEEPFDRGWYAGPVGFFDEEGNGVFAPALRSAVANGRTWRLFAGAGIVAGSHPALEWEETGIKFQPILRALEASGARVGE